MENLNKRRLQKAATRERILECALVLFEKDGFSTVRTQDIALAAEIAHGSLFVHFPTRDDLIVAAIDKFAGEACLQTRQSLKDTNSLEEILKAHVNSISKNEALHAHLVSENFLLPPKSRATVLEINAVIANQLSQALQGKTHHLQQKKVPSHFIFNLWIGLLNHYLMNRDIFAPNKSVMKTRGPELIKHFITLLNLGEKE